MPVCSSSYICTIETNSLLMGIFIIIHYYYSLFFMNSSLWNIFICLYLYILYPSIFLTSLCITLSYMWHSWNGNSWKWDCWSKGHAPFTDCYIIPNWLSEILLLILISINNMPVYLCWSEFCQSINFSNFLVL